MGLNGIWSYILRTHVNPAQKQQIYAAFVNSLHDRTFGGISRKLTVPVDLHFRFV